MNVGILGVGTYLPPNVRKNDYWSSSQTRDWVDRARRRLDRMREAVAHDDSELTRKTLAAMASVVDDPFQGAVERRVISDDMKASDMEIFAAREAIQRANVPLDEIDLVMSHQICPDYISASSATVVHASLGLRESCQAITADAACNSFMQQLTLAQAMIESGRARYVLVTQASTLTRYEESGEVIDSWNGDAGSAAILGPVKEGHGVLAISHHTDGKLWGSIVGGVPGGRWQQGRCRIYSEDPRANLDWVLGLGARARNAVDEALAKAGIRREDVGFFVSQQGFRWLHPLLQDATGLGHARCVEHFHYTGATSSVNVLFQLAVGEKENLLRPGDLVACFQGGSGMTWSGMALRWGGAL